MSVSNLHRTTGYLIAAAGVVLAGLSRWWLTPLTGDFPPVSLMLVVVVGAMAWLSGFGPALFATILGLLAIVLANDPPGDWPTRSTQLFRFGSLAFLISVLFWGLIQSRKQAQAREQESRRSEARYRRLIETAGQGIWVIDHEGRTTYANPRLGEILGIPPAQLIGMPLYELLVEDAASWTGAETQPDPFAWHEVRLQGGGGRICHAIVTSRAIGPDEVPTDSTTAHGNTSGGLLVMVTDVTPLKETEEALREKESVLRSFYESSVIAMGVVQLTENDTRFVSANALADKFFGVKPGGLEGRSASQLNAPPAMLATWNERFRECQATGRPVRFEYCGTCPSSPSWVSATLSPMESRGSGRALCSFVVEDITDRKRTEEELVDAKSLAEAASHAKDRFLAVLSHELRTPLTPVLIAVSSLLESKVEPSLLSTLEMIRRNIELEARLIDDLLDLSRIFRGRLRLDLEVVDIHQVIRRAMEVCRDETLVAGLCIMTELKALRHHVLADHSRIMQVVWNLIRNAAKFTPAGGRLTIRTSNPAAVADLSGNGNSPKLTIEFLDTGIGIEPTVLPRIFDPFEQGDDEVRGRSNGLGLGLAISRSLTVALGGQLTASSPGRGQGSTFRLELTTVLAPISAKPSRAGALSSALPARAPDRRSLHILLVEDNRDTLCYLANVLRQRGHQVVTADHFAAAIAAFKETEIPFDLLLSDIELPDGDGLNLMREIKANGRMAGVAMSGFGGEEDLRQSREAGFFDHLTKPIDLNRLDAAIRHATEDEASRNSSGDDGSTPFRLRASGNGSGEFKIVWSRDRAAENSSL
jgi:PAS domain S-box-containing protein